MVLTSTPVVGLPALTGWAQVVHNHSGHLVCAYAVSGQNAHNLGRDLADLITSTELPDAVSLHQLILDLLSRTRKAGSTLQFAAILQADDHLVLGAHQGQVLYHRNGATRALVQAAAEPQLLEGKLIPDTTLIALTQQATSHSELLTQQLTQGWDADTIVTSLLPSLHEQADSALSALAFVTVTGETRQPEIMPEPEINTEPAPAEASWRADLGSPSYPDSAEPETAVPAPLPVRQTLASSRRNLPPLPQFSGSLGAVGKTWAAVKSTIQRSVLSGRRLNYLVQSWRNNWQHTLPKAKQQFVIMSLAVVFVLGLIISGLIWFVQTKKSTPGSAAQPTSATTDNSANNQPQELSVFFDLRLTEPTFLANQVKVVGTTAYFADLENKKVIQLDLTKKQSSLLPLGSVNKLTDVSVSGQALYLLGGGLNRWDIQQTSPTPQPAKNLKAEGDSDREGTLLGSFGSYLYVLNPPKRNIFRFAVDKDDKVSEPIGWLVNKKGLDFPQLISFAIDGDVWLTDKTGHVFKFTQGQPVDWQLSGLKTPLDSPVYAVTDDSLTKLYLLEPNRHRLLVVEKTGQLVKEIDSPTLAAVTSFGVSENLQKAFAVSGSTVYEIGL